MKAYALLLVLGLACFSARAQNCAGIAQKIEAAYQNNQLDEGLQQVRALRACDVSPAGKQAADEWTGKIFKKIQDNEKRARKAEAEARAQTAIAEKEARAGFNAALALQTVKNDVTLALRMADYNLARHPTNAAAAAAFKEIISNPQHAFYTRAFESITREEETKAARRLKPGLATNMASVDFSPDGQEILTGAEYGKARLWSLSTGKVIRVFDRPGVAVFSPDGGQILIGNEMFDKNSGKELFLFEIGEYRKIKLIFSKQGQIAYLDSDTLFLRTKRDGGWDLLKIEIPDAWSLAFSPDGKEIATGTTEGLAQIWSTENGQELDHFKKEAVEWAESLAFSSDGQELLIGYEYEAILWSRRTKQAISHLTGFRHSINAVAFSPDGRSMLTGSRDGTTRLWSHETGQEIRRFEVYDHLITAAAFSPDGRYILTGGSDGIARLWPCRDEQNLLRIPGEGYINSLALSPDGQEVLAETSDTTVQVWSVTSGKEILRLKQLDKDPGSVNFSPDGRELFTVDKFGRAIFWSRATGRQTEALGELWEPGTVSLLSAFYSPDGSQIMIIGYPGFAGIYPRHKNGNGKGSWSRNIGCTAGAFSPDGQGVLAGYLDGSVTLLDGKTGEPIRHFFGHTEGISAVAFSRDGREIAAGAEDGTVWLWSAATGEPLCRMTGHSDDVNYLAFSADGREILTGSTDGTARLWGRESCQEIRRFEAPERWISAVGLSRDGTKVALGDQDGPIQIFSTPRPFLEKWVASFPIAALLAAGLQIEDADMAFIQTPAELLLAAETFEKRGQWKPAKKFYEKAWQDSVYNTSKWIKLYELCTLGRMNMTAVYQGFQQLADSSDQEGAAYFFEVKKDYALAKAFYEKAWHSTLSDPQHLALLYTICRKGKLASAGYKTALDHIEDSVQLLVAAYALDMQDEWALAYRLYEKAWKADLFHPDHLATLYLCAVKGGLNASAVTSAIDAIDDPEYLLQISENLERDGGYPKAIELQGKILQKNGPDEGSLYHLSRLAKKSDSDISALLQQFDTFDDPEDLKIVAEFYIHYQRDTLQARRFYQKSWARAPSFEVYKGLLRSSDHTPEDSIALWQIFLLKADASALVYAAEQLLKAEDWKDAEQLARLSIDKADNARARYCLYVLGRHTGGDNFEALFLPDDTARLAADYRFFTARNTEDETRWSYFFNGPEFAGATDEEHRNYYSCAARIAEKRMQLDSLPVLRAESADTYNSLAWYQLLTAQFAAAEQSVRRGLELDGGNLYLHTNLPPAILLQGGRFAEARALYLEWADKPFVLNGLGTFKAAFLQDLESFLTREIVSRERVGEVKEVMGLLGN